MSTEVLTDVRSRLRALIKDETVNRWLPRSRNLPQLCSSWARKVRCEEVVGTPPRSPAVVRPGREVYRPYTMANVRCAAERKLFTVVSLFAGAGGSSTGYRLAGGDVRAAVEFNPRAAEAYRRHSPNCLVVEHSIRDVLRGDGVERMLRRACLEPGKLDLLDFSPPCGEFSKAGHGAKKDKSRLTNHGGVKQTYSAYLPLDSARLMQLARPLTGVAENVVGMVEDNAPLFKRFLHSLRFNGAERAYYVAWEILSAADHGVAQSRRRVIVISVRTDVAERVGIHSDRDVLQVFPRPTRGLVSVRSALEGLEQRAQHERPFLTPMRASPLLDRIRQLEKNPPRVRRQKNPTQNFALARCSWDWPAPTLTVQGQMPSGFFGGATHPELDRKFTVPEQMRLTGLPDDFPFAGTVSDVVTCIGNMVPPLLIKAIAESVYEHVLKPYRDLSGD